MDRRQELVGRLKALVRQLTMSDPEITEETSLSDLGVNSFHVIAMIFDLKKEYGPRVEERLASRMPSTFGELVALAWEPLSRSGEAS